MTNVIRYIWSNARNQKALKKKGKLGHSMVEPTWDQTGFVSKAKGSFATKIAEGDNSGCP